MDMNEFSRRYPLFAGFIVFSVAVLVAFCTFLIAMFFLSYLASVIAYPRLLFFLAFLAGCLAGIAIFSLRRHFLRILYLSELIGILINFIFRS